MNFNIVLIAAAVIPALLLMVRVYRLDRLEKESRGMLWALVRGGILCSLVALLAERVLGEILDATVTENYTLYLILLYFGIVAFSEEGAKYVALRRTSWNSPEFNCQYDGIVYAVFVSLGFALWENISYVMSYGLEVAIVRALTAIPGHTCFGVLMGVYYGLARRQANEGRLDASRRSRRLALLVPALLHGAYDYIASIESENSGLYFLGFIIVLFIVTRRTAARSAREDRYIA